MFTIDIMDYEFNGSTLRCEDVIFDEVPNIGEHVLLDVNFNNIVVPKIERMIEIEVLGKTEDYIKCQFIRRHE